MSAARAVGVLRMGWGVLLLAAPRSVLAVLAPKERNSPRARGVVVILGGRNLAQAVIELLRPSPAVLGIAAGVDATHALTFIAVATARPHARWRRAALLNVLTALAFCAATTTTMLAAGEWPPPAGLEEPKP